MQNINPNIQAHKSSEMSWTLLLSPVRLGRRAHRTPLWVLAQNSKYLGFIRLSLRRVSPKNSWVTKNQLCAWCNPDLWKIPSSQADMRSWGAAGEQWWRMGKGFSRKILSIPALTLPGLWARGLEQHGNAPDKLSGKIRSSFHQYWIFFSHILAWTRFC